MNSISKCALVGATLSLAACASSPAEPSVAATSACAGLPNAQAEAVSLYQPGVMYAASPVEEKVFIARAIQPVRTFGADVYVRAQKGMTEQYLERVLSCHTASGVAAHPNDPLHPSEGRIAELSVRSAGDSLAIRIIGDSPSTGQEILQRARSVTSSGAEVTVEQLASTAPGVRSVF